MNFEDEEYVRVYTKKTNTFRKLGWEGRTVLWHLFIEADKAGYIEFDEGDDLVESVAELIDMPEEIVRVGLERLASRGVTTRHGGSLVIARFVEAQNAKRSDRLRAQDYRDRKRFDALIALHENSVNTEQNEESSRGITGAHEAPSLVTNRHPSPCPALPPPASPPHPRESARESGVRLSSSQRQTLALQQAQPEDVAVLEAWRDRFKKEGVFFTADRAVNLAERRAEDMTHQDAIDALEGAAVDDWFVAQGAKLELIFGKRSRFESYRDAGRAIRQGKAPAGRPKGVPAPRQPDSGTYSPLANATRVQ